MSAQSALARVRFWSTEARKAQSEITRETFRVLAMENLDRLLRANNGR